MTVVAVVTSQVFSSDFFFQEELIFIIIDKQDLRFCHRVPHILGLYASTRQDVVIVDTP